MSHPTGGDSRTGSLYSQHGRTVLPPLTIASPTSDSPGLSFNIALIYMNSTFTALKVFNNIYPSNYPAQHRFNPVPYGHGQTYHISPQQQTQPDYTAYPFDTGYSGGQTYGSYGRSSPSSSSADPRRLPPLNVPRSDSQGSPTSHAAFHMPPPPSSPFAVYSHRSSYPQYQSLTSNPYRASHTSPGVTGPAVAPPNSQPMSMGPSSGELNLPTSRSAQHPYARAPPVMSPVEYDTQTESTEPLIRKKRKRADARQLEMLSATYVRTAFPSTEERAQLAKDLDMSARSVQIWFQNKRQSDRQAGRNVVNYPTNPAPAPAPVHTTTPPVGRPEMLHPTLSTWLKNMNKLSDLIDRLEDLASGAHSDHKPQLQGQVAKLRATFKRQQERCVEFLRLSEEYANQYLLDISDEIQQQSSFLDMLEKRLDMAKTLRGQAVHLQKSYESGTVNVMKNVSLSEPLPRDFDLFSEVHFVLGEIRRCYMELDKFWTEEIRSAIKALETRRVDPNDVERWRGFKASLEQTIESWKTGDAGSRIRGTPGNSLPDSSGADLGMIASSLSPALGKLEETLQRVQESASVEFSPMSVSPVLQAKVGLRQNSGLCLTFLRHCVDFGEIITTLFVTPIINPILSCIRASTGLQERVMALRTEAADISAENTTHSPGLRKFSSVYKQSLSLQRKTTVGLNSLLESASSWIVVTDGLPGAPPGGSSVGLLRNLADAWEKGRVSIRMALAELSDDEAERSRYRSLCLHSPRRQSFMKRLMTRLVYFTRSSMTISR
ncbi:hypothetical protein F5148DRAFT_1290819 [Russula earlei]|uniref:Uncharacterized protein n=1 Tax=Russula earlei TaxID=71964 RepID=A0ACC0TW58_9AGAM|nr:hypothetical protein F5148DRAFT_1290819 [Russula earlei]